MKFNVVFYMGEGRIKFLQVAQTGKKLVAAVDVINIVGQSDAQVSQTLINFIKSRKLNFAECRVTLVFPRSRVILRHMIFPSQKPEEIRSMIDLQIGSKIPFTREEVEIDFQILSKTPDGYAKVAVAVIPQEIAMRYWRIFAGAKIPLQGMTISSIGLWLLFQQQRDLPESPCAMVDLDTDHSEICLCHQGHWLNSREIPVGLAQMQRDGYDEILKQWKLTQDSVSNEQLSSTVRMVYLASAMKGENALKDELAKTHHDLNVKEIYFTQNLNMARGVQWPKSITDEGISMAPLAGIAFSSEAPPIDLIPRSVRQSQEQRAYQRQLIILGVWVAAALISLGLALGVGFFRKNVQLARLEDQLRETKHKARRVEDQLQKIHDIEGMLSGRLVFFDLAREIDRLLPSGAYLVNITIADRNTLSLQGASNNTVAINQFQQAMVDSPSFSNVSLDYVNKRVGAQGEVDYFKITCTLKSVNGQQ